MGSSEPLIIRGIFEGAMHFMLIAPCGRGLLLFFRGFSIVLAGVLLWPGGYALIYDCSEFGDFFDFSKFPKILSLILFGNS